MIASNGVMIAAGGTLQGSGDVMADVVNGGVISPSYDENQEIDVIFIDGDYTQTSSGTYVVHVGNAPASDGLAIFGHASLGGTLNVIWIGSGSPSGSWTVMSFTTWDGTMFTLTGDPGFTAIYMADSVRLQAGSGAPTGGGAENPGPLPVDKEEPAPFRAEDTEALRSHSEDRRYSVQPIAIDALPVKKNRSPMTDWVRDLVFASTI